MGTQERMHGVDKMYTEGDSQEEELEIWKEDGLGKFGGGGLTRVENIMVLVWGWSEMVVNSCLEDLEQRMTLKRMWQRLFPQLGKKEEQLSGGEQWSRIYVVSPEKCCWWTVCAVQKPWGDKSWNGFHGVKLKNMWGKGASRDRRAVFHQAADESLEGG